MKRVITLILIFSSLFCNAQIFEDDFESGDFSNWTSTTVPTGATMSASATAAKNGSYGQYVDLAGSSSGYHYALANYDFTEDQSYDVWFRGWLYLDDLSTINTVIGYNRGRLFFVQNGDAATVQFSLNIYNSSGTYKINAYLGLSKAYSTDITVSLDTWYEIKMRCKNSSGTSADTLQLWINTVSQGIKSQALINSADYFDYLRCGFYPNMSMVTDATVYWDDVGIYASDPGDFPTGSTGWTGRIIGITDPSKIIDIDVSGIDNVIGY